MRAYVDVCHCTCAALAAFHAPSSTRCVQAETQRYDERYITKLLKNYRSHPKILELPNKLFYQVRCCGLQVRCCGLQVRCCGLQVRCCGLLVRCCGLQVRCCVLQVRCCGLQVRCCVLPGEVLWPTMPGGHLLGEAMIGHSMLQVRLRSVRDRALSGAHMRARTSAHTHTHRHTHTHVNTSSSLHAQCGLTPHGGHALCPRVRPSVQGELQVCADHGVTHSLLNFKGLPSCRWGQRPLLVPRWLVALHTPARHCEGSSVGCGVLDRKLSCGTEQVEREQS